MTVPLPPVPTTPTEEAAPPARRRSWWRRNLAALAALAVLLPATTAAVGWQEWYQYFGFGARAVAAVPVAEGEEAELADATWGPIRGGEIDDLTGLDVPPGTRLIAVAVPVDPDEEGIGCDTPALVEQATGREWQSVRTEIGLPWNADEPENCVSSTAGAYEMILPFVVPDDVEGPFWIDVQPYDAGGSFLRFAFEL